MPVVRVRVQFMGIGEPEERDFDTWIEALDYIRGLYYQGYWLKRVEIIEY